MIGGARIAICSLLEREVPAFAGLAKYPTMPRQRFVYERIGGRPLFARCGRFDDVVEFGVKEVPVQRSARGKNWMIGGYTHRRRSTMTHEPTTYASLVAGQQK